VDNVGCRRLVVPKENITITNVGGGPMFIELPEVNVVPLGTCLLKRWINWFGKIFAAS